MRKAALIFNPSSGRNQQRARAHAEAAASALQAAGIAATLVPTLAAGSAKYQVQEAVAEGHDAIFACGGDGTMHDVLQGIMSLPDPRAIPLGIVPRGTGNVLANDLKLPRDPVAAIEAQLRGAPRTIAAGRIDYLSLTAKPKSRYFATTAGVGPDALMLDTVGNEAKDRYGLLAYIVTGLRINITHDFPLYEAQYVNDANGKTEQALVSQLMAVRINNFGNIMQRFAPGAGLDRDDFQLVLFKTRSVHKFNLYMLGVLSGMHWKVKGVDLVYTRQIEVKPLPDEVKASGGSTRIRCEADGEFLGAIPATISIVPLTFSLLMPK